MRGAVEDGVAAFKGIPYAAPPFGAHRFAAPQPVTPWDGERDATVFGPTAPHPGYAPPFDTLLPEVHIAGEDCLTVNVWAPADATPDAALPVAVWVHGGAFVNGSAAIPTYDGTAFARDGLVVVTLNYRLGIEGWLYFGDGGAENRGLLDQIAALRWVQEEVAAFGGDPTRVTVFGESAGAMSIAALLVAPAAAGLFGRAILQSGAGHHAIGPSSADLVRGELAGELGIDELTREALAALDPKRLLEAQVAVARAAQLTPDAARWGEVALNSMAFEPVVDGEVIPGLPIDLLAAGAFPDIELLIGTNAEEQRLWLVPTGVLAQADAAALAFVAGRYGVDPSPYRDDRTPGEVLSAVMGDWFFRVPAVRLAEAALDAGRPVHLYEFAWRSPLFDGTLGACHAVELAFVFDTLGATGTTGLAGDAPPQELADEVHAAWVAFVRDGDPGWARYDRERRATMLLDDRASQLVDDPRAGEREAWDGIR